MGEITSRVLVWDTTTIASSSDQRLNCSRGCVGTRIAAAGFTLWDRVSLFVGRMFGVRAGKWKGYRRASH